MEDQYAAKFYENIESKLPDLDYELVAWQYSFEISHCMRYLEELQDPETTPRFDVKHPAKKCDETTKFFREWQPYLVQAKKINNR